MPRYSLKPIEYDEISFVAHGANPDADIVLAKSAKGSKMSGGGETKKAAPTPGDVHVNVPLPVGSKKKKVDAAEVKIKESGSKTSDKKKKLGAKSSDKEMMYKALTNIEIMADVLDLGSDMTQIISDGGTRQDVAKLLQDHADLVSHNVEGWITPDISKSMELDSEIVESLTSGQEFLNTVLAKAGSESGDMPKITDEDRAGLSEPVQKYIEELEANKVSKDEDDDIDEYEVDVEMEDDEDENEDGVGKAKGVRKPKIKRMKLVSGNKRSSGSKQFTGGGMGGGFGKSADADVDTVLKSLDPAAQSIMKSLIGSNKELLEEVEKGKKEKEIDVWVKTAKAWTHLPGKPEEIGAKLWAVEKALGEDAAKDLAAQFEAAQSMAKQSNIFKSAGVGGGEASDSTAKIEKAVSEKVEKYKEDGVSDEVAKAKAMQAVFAAHPEYYDESVGVK